MKQKIFFTLLALGTGIFVLAQKAPVVKVYAYSQTVLPGAKKNNAVEENGAEIKQDIVKKTNYFFYAEQKRSATIKVIAVWMQGKKYNAKADSVSKTPVEIRTGDATDGSQKIKLDPGPGNKFLFIIPGEAATTGLKPSGGLKKMIKASELVLIYQWKGKLWYFPVKKIKEIEPVAAV